MAEVRLGEEVILLDGSLQRLGTRLVAALGLFRIINCLALGFLFVSSKRYYGLHRLDFDNYLEALTWILLAAFAYAYNDLCDVEVDRVNKPRRALPSGAVSIASVKLSLSLIALAIAVLILLVWRTTLLWPLGAIAAGVVYSSVLRTRTALLSNVTAACLVAAVPLSGSQGYTNVRLWELAFGIMLLMFGREMQKDVVDHQGDQVARPMPLLMGKRSNIFTRLYPLMLLTAGGLLFLATYSMQSAVGFIGSLMLLAIILLAVMECVGERPSNQLQAHTLKFASYWLVLLLLVRGV